MQYINFLGFLIHIWHIGNKEGTSISLTSEVILIEYMYIISIICFSLILMWLPKFTFICFVF